MQRALAVLLFAAALAGCGDDLLPDAPDASPEAPDVDALDPDAEVDGAAPQTTITDAPASLTRLADATFAFVADEDATFECRVDAAAFAPCASPHALTVADGAHTFAVRAIDAAGNVDEAPATHAWTTDTVAPTTAIVTAPPALDNSTTVTIEFAAGEAATYQCRFDGGEAAPCTSPQTFPGLGDGDHAFAVQATDTAGNAEAAPVVHRWTIDTSTPDTVLEAGPEGAVASPTATFSFSSPDAGAGATYECRLDAPSFTPCTSPVEATGLAEGGHSFLVRVRDAVGNVDATPAIRHWTVDTIAPETAIETGPQGTVATAAPSFTFASDPGATFQCTLDGGEPAPCTSPLTLAALADGAHTLAVLACDVAGNCDATPATRDFTVDTTAPETTITQAPWTPNRSNVVDFAFTSEPGATFHCRINDRPAQPCTSPHTYWGFSDGTRTFRVHACDAVGNCDATPAAHTWTIDTVPPETTMTSAPPAVTSDDDPTFEFTSEPGATFRCRLQAAAPVPCSSPQHYTDLDDGYRTFRVYACDAAGNCDQTPEQHQWTIENGD